jgi:hypothetical protein
MHARTFPFWVLLLFPLACGGDADQPPPGACMTGGTATGSYLAACNQCAKDKCDAQLKAKAGSGWQRQYFGGDGDCVAFNGCVCQCLASGANPLACSTTTCFSKLDTTCQAAERAAQDCLRTNCTDVCR